MSSLVYLVAVGIKNRVKETIRKPSKLILYGLILAGFIGLLVLSLFNRPFEGEEIPLFWLEGLIFALIVMFLVLGIQKGLTSGDAIFDMSDVNFLFVSPLNPRTILLYGLTKMAKVSFFAGFFILFQSSTLSMFGVGFGGLMILFFIFMFCVITLSLLSLIIYSVSNGTPSRKRIVKIVSVLVFVPVVIYFGLQYLSGGDPASALESTTHSLFFSAIPIAGWAAASIAAFYAGNTLAGLAWLAPLVVGCCAMIVYIMASRVDYYEDVLVATETAFEKRRAVAEGDIQAATSATRKVRVTKTGLSGQGAPTFFYKHLRETFRENRFGFFNISSLIMIIIVLVVSFALREELDIITILQVLMWIQVFLIGTGRGLKEIYIHYIYLVPEPPFKKIVWSNLELVFKTFLESLLLLVVPGAILGAQPLVIIAAVATYTLFTLFLLGINYLSMRWTEVDVSQGVMIILYMLAVIILILPGLVPALILGFTIGGTLGTLVGLIILSVWELIAATICFMLSKNVLHSTDMPVLKVN